MLRSRSALLGLAPALLLLPLAGKAQEREVVSKEVSVGRSEAALRLEFSDGGTLALALRDGAVMVDDEPVGSYDPGDALDRTWRLLLAEAVALENGPLTEALRDWSPPSALEGEDLTLARKLDEALESVLAAPAEPEPVVSLSGGAEGEAGVVRVLLNQLPRLAAFGDAFEELGPDIVLHVDEDVEVAGEETVSGSLVVIQGDARIAGTVEGDVVVVDGTLDLLEGGSVSGDVRLADAELGLDEGAIGGDVVDVVRRELEQVVRDRLREELRTQIRNEVRASSRSTSGLFNPLRRIASGIGGVIQDLIAVVILGLIGLGVVSFAPRNLDVVAETARRSPGRAAMVGLAGAFLLVPVYVLGFIALLVTIVGIPVAVAWLPVFPLAALAAGLLGYLAVARNVGEWLADSGYRYTDWIRKSNTMTTLTGGLLGLMAFFIAAHVLGMVPFFGFFRGLLEFAGVTAAIVAVLIGFGAVLLTRAGRHPEYRAPDFDEAWAHAVDAEREAKSEAGAQPPGETSDA